LRRVEQQVTSSRPPSARAGGEQLTTVTINERSPRGHRLLQAAEYSIDGSQL